MTLRVGQAFAADRPVLLHFALSLAVIVVVALGIRRDARAEGAWAGVTLTLLGVCYCAWLLGHAIWLHALPGGRALTLFLLGVTWCGESAAFFVSATTPSWTYSLSTSWSYPSGTATRYGSSRRCSR